MTLREKQALFVRLIAQLFIYAHLQGWDLTLGEAYRSPEEAARLAKAGKGITASLHCQRLALDVNLFIDGVYQPETLAYRALGEWWEQQHEWCRWGGRFTREDGNHFSLTHGGRA